MKIQSVQINHTYRDQQGVIQMDTLNLSTKNVKVNVQMLLDLPCTISVDAILSYHGKAK